MWQMSRTHRSNADISSYASKNGIALPTGKASYKARVERALRRSYDDAVDTWSDSDLKGMPLSCAGSVVPFVMKRLIAVC